MKHEVIPTDRKALKINIDTNFYGSFAEIGGGQEVARHFFTAGGSSETVAKSISAYDKVFSDVLYNNNLPGRYVSEDRLVKMLTQEYFEVCDLLQKQKPLASFFAYANTVETLNYRKTNNGHGWLGVKFQSQPLGMPNTVLLHVDLLENDGLLQQATLGILGVNLVYACKYYMHDHDNFVLSLLDNISTDRVKITMLRMTGPDFESLDNRLLAVKLVKFGMTNAIMFDKEGNVQQPSDMLYKKNVITLRGVFKPITNVTEDILNRSLDLFKNDEDYEPDNTLTFCELSFNDIMSEGEVNATDFLQRVDMLNEFGQNVMVSDFREYFKLVKYFSDFKLKKLRIIIGVPTFEKFLDRNYYRGLPGGIMEALAKMFPENMKLYVYPTRDTLGDELIDSKKVRMDDDIRLLYEYLMQNKFILDLSSNFDSQLHVRSYQVLEMIRGNKAGWEKFVPEVVAKAIKEKGYYLA